MRVLVCGSRGWTDWERVEIALQEIHSSHSIDVIIEGGARGPDTFARDWARIHVGRVLEFKADWKAYGRRAGITRNALMLGQGKPDLVLAFWDGQSQGTAHMLALAVKHKIPTRVITSRSDSRRHHAKSTSSTTSSQPRS